MNYEELTQQVKALEKEQKEIKRSIEAEIRRRDKNILDLKLQYIEEHQPLPLKRFQRIKVTARVTEESRKRMTEDYRNMKKYALGATYTITGVFNGYRIDDAGQVVPCFYGKGDYRGSYDEILSVKLTADQPEGNCNKCLKAKDGLCYMMGGKDRGPKYAVWKIDEDKMVPCPKYEEVVEGGLYALKDKIWPAKHYPKVTRVKTKDGKWKYRLYEGDWNCYTVSTEWEIENYYTSEPQDYQEEDWTMKTIFKTRLSIIGEQTVELPQGARILHIGKQNGAPCIWYECDTGRPTMKVTILCFGTGYRMDDAPEMEYIGTVQIDGYVALLQEAARIY